MTDRGMVIIGAGHAGVSAALALRASGWRHTITLLEEQDVLPYERPPLSKSILRGERTIEDHRIFPPDKMEEQEITFRRNARVAAIDRNERHIILSDGQTLTYERLLLAPGAEARSLSIPGSDRAGVLTLRDAADAAQLRERIRIAPGSRLAIVGGGLIGLEVAASARALGCAVTIIEVGHRIMMRTLHEELAHRVQSCHEQAGVEFCFNKRIGSIVGNDEIRGVELDDGTIISSTTVLVCVGAAPRVELAKSAGLAIDNGIAVDRHLRTSDPFIYAAGDACAFELQDGRRTRLECWKTANDQGATAGRNMLGMSEVYFPEPWLWSDQYDKSVQVAGYPDRSRHNVDRFCQDDSHLIFHLGEYGEVVGFSGFGSSRQVGHGAKVAQLLMRHSVRPSPTELGDASVDLRSLLSSAAA
ncbi:FAD-dependent oxidoreductase [Mesorhizobium sp. M1340]|uniref:NAD(P)/FAD-dependent oxidoreductase n=1 Tax=Mesorhizobium sp. M1340 TaxID=2957087 RepID=UPI003334F397